jgi:hypothetical protein
VTQTNMREGSPQATRKRGRREGGCSVHSLRPAFFHELVVYGQRVADTVLVQHHHRVVLRPVVRHVCVRVHVCVSMCACTRMCVCVCVSRVRLCVHVLVRSAMNTRDRAREGGIT